MIVLLFLVCAVLTYIVAKHTISLFKWVFSLFNPVNCYIKAHEFKLRNDNSYSVYLKWCDKKGEIPMNKAVFLKDVEDKENQINKMIK